MSSKKQPQKSKYGYLQLHDAYKAVKEKGFAVRKAARQHGLPESTLRWRLANLKGEDVKWGGQTIFSRNQEEMLAEHCVSMAHLGYGFSRWQVLEMAKNMSEAIGRDSEPTKHWFYSFIQRFPELKMINPKKRDKARDDAVNDETLSAYFEELGNVLDKYDIKNKPQFIWNVDETGISLDHNPPKILARAGTNPHCVTSGRSATTTVIAAVSALGETIPPFVIFKGDRLSKDIRTDGVAGTEYRSSQTGWSNSNLFLDFFTNHFMHHITTRPCVLLYDGHSTHVTCDVIEAARQEGVHLFVLPPHTSHCFQPLDVSVFSPFKKNLSSECHKFLHAHPSRVLVKEDLPNIIGTAFSSSMTVSTIMSGFRKTGIFPYDPTSPHVSPPQITKEKPVVKATRKERKDNRVVKILFQEKSDEFNKLKENVEPKKKRSTFVPPYGAAITEDAFYEKKKMMEKEKKEKEEKKERNKKEKEEKRERNEKEKEEKREEKKKKGPCKRKQRFTTPYTQRPGPSDEIIIDDDVEKCNGKKARTDCSKEKCAKTTQGKGIGPLKNSKRGKGPAKKGQKNIMKVEPVIEENDSVNCAVCGKWQPDELNLQLQIQLVTWGQCDKCGCWVHLKFCSAIRELNDDDEFRCPRCENEQ